jgi:hypothetical protein
MNLPDFITHYFESDKGPFRNICDLSDAEIAPIIASERQAKTPFNRFAIGIDFFKIRRAADDLLIKKYSEKFGISPQTRPYFAVLGDFDRTMTMYRDGRSLRIDISSLASEHVTFMYPDHFNLVWSDGLFTPNFPYSHRPFHDLLFTYSELPAAIMKYGLSRLIARAKRQEMWVSSYTEAHIWDPDIRQTIQGKTRADLSASADARLSNQI